MTEGLEKRCQRVVAQFVGEREGVVKGERVDGVALLVNEVDAVLVADGGAEAEAQGMLLADGGVESVVGIGAPVAVHVVGLPCADACQRVVAVAHGEGVLDDGVAEPVMMRSLFLVGVSPLLAEGELVADGIAQAVIAYTDVQRVGIVAHINEVLQIGRRCLGDVLEIQFLGMTCLMVDGFIFDKAVPDVDGHRAASDECVDAATLVMKFLANDGDGETELCPPLFLASLVFAVGVVEESGAEFVDVFGEVARITVAVVNVLLVFMRRGQLAEGVCGVDVEE